MSVKIYISNDLERLAEKVNPNATHPMKPSVFITQTEGIKHWLSLKLAKKEGIFTNFKFYKPNQFINEVAFQMHTGNPKAYNNENLRWWLFHILNDGRFKKLFPGVATYYLSDDLRRIQLACKVADLFDQYLVYRTDMMVDWSDLNYQEKDDERWQCWLWREIKKNIEEKDEQAIDKAKYKQIIQDSLKKDGAGDILKKSFPVIHVFGLSIITKFHLELYQSLSENIDVRFYLLNPAPDEYWYDCVSDKDIAKKWSKRWNRDEVEEMSEGNPLLISWGKVGQELFSELLEIDDVFINAIESEYVPHNTQSLLSTLQGELSSNLLLNEGEPLDEALLQDQSIQIASNYTPAREVEVLYDFLIETIDKQFKGQDIEPQDIVVMVPKIQEYIPFIKTVFDNAQVKLPYSIGDEPIENAHAITSLVISILGISEKDFTSENVLQLLDYEGVLRHYGLSDVAFLRQAVNDCTIRFGIDGDQSAETHLVSWKNGLRKMIFGIAMRDEEFKNDQGVIEPFISAEGAHVQELIGFVRFVEDLIKVIRIAEQERTLQAWVQYVQFILDTFVEEDYTNEDEFASLRTRLDAWLDSNEMTVELKLSFQVFYFLFKDFHVNEIQKEGYFKGRITFCTALPMRSIPFKIIAFLGLNANDFPRKSAPLGFDLMENGVRIRGDRSMKDNDRYLFLEAFMSAKNFLYLSYLGRSSKDNSVKNPSIVMDELLDYIARRTHTTLETVKKALIKAHPLNAYSNKYLQSTSGISTYFPINQGGEKVLSVSKETTPATKPDRHVTLEELISYFKHPIRWYFNKVMGVYYREETNVIDETECFAIERGLQQSTLRNGLLDVSEEQVQDFIREQKRKGMLPLANMGVADLMHDYKEVVQEVVERKRKYTENARLTLVEDELELAGYTLHAAPIYLHDNRLVSVSFSSDVGKYSLENYIRFLYLRALGIEASTLLLTKAEHDLSFEATSLSTEQAKELLSELLLLFVENKEQLLPFHLKNSTKFMESLKKPSKTPFDLMKLIRTSEKLDNDFSWDDYCKTSFRCSEVWNDTERFETLSQQILQPMMDLEKEVSRV